ncbi:hypothetical protein FJR38_23705 [Anabaena sp. UHCC 0253]|uniref:DUF6334 family protein n=1 Tax=Anabaena sp. UHCC 0253 TaxID=2590019 RepID=UPI001446CEA6|nr:DUF6334 family protein [Anabaena sp. UHCC 0253]MTJ55468.1 hypothetical protein [Anabaena sp. UHCC 0253]
MVINEFPIGQTLLGVSTQEDQEFDGDELCLDQVKLYFEDTEHKITWITISPIIDTDEIDVKIEKNIKKATKKIPIFMLMVILVIINYCLHWFWVQS